MVVLSYKVNRKPSWKVSLYQVVQFSFLLISVFFCHNLK